MNTQVAHDVLSDAQRRGAMLTGLWAMPLMAAGLVVSVLPGIVFIVVVLVFVVGGLLFGGGLGGGLFIGMLASIAGGLVIVAEPWLVIVPFVLGLLAFIGGCWGSVRSLRRLGIRAPKGVTWSAFGVGFATQLVAAGFVYVAVIIVSALFSDGPVTLNFLYSEAPFVTVPGMVFHAIVLLMTIGIGMLFWPVFARVVQRRGLASIARAS